MSTTQQFIVGVSNVPEAPTDISLSANTVSENVPDNTFIGSLSTSDPDVGDSHSYSLVEGQGDADNAVFSIVNNELRLNASPDFENQSNYSIRVKSIDRDGLSVEKVLNVSILNVNEAPTRIDLSNDNIPEDAPPGTVVGQLTTVDPDAGDTHIYTLLDDAQGRFTLVGNEIKVAPGAILDFNTQNNYIIEIGTIDTGGLTVTQQFSISVIDVNQAPTNLELSVNSIAENVPDNSVVGTFSTTDPDLGDSHNYSLVTGIGDTDNDAFTIEGEALRIKLSPDEESKSSYSIRVRSTDSGGLNKELVLTVNIENINEAPSSLAIDKTNIEENAAPGTIIGTLSATDPDNGDTLTYSLLNDADGRFEIINNQLVIGENALLDFETLPSYTLVLSVTDAGGLSATRQVTIDLSDLNETPSDLSLDNNTIVENNPVNSIVGIFSTTDPDFNDTYNYTLVTGEGDSDNEAFNIINNELYLNNSADFETKSNYSIRVRSTDNNGLSVEKIFNVSITNINESPIDLLLDTNTVAENVPVNTIIGNLSTLDPDNPDSHIYTLVTGVGDSDNGAFSIVDNELLLNNSPDFESKSSYSIRIGTTDEAGLSVEKVKLISVTNVNEAPSELLLSANSIEENVPANTVIGNFITTDPDSEDSHTYSLITGVGDTDNNAFNIIDNQLRINNSPDFESKSSYTIRVNSTDELGLSIETIFTINITDLIEEPILPQISADLLNDTGISNLDGLTASAEIIGSIANAASVTSFLAKINDRETVNVLDILQSDGSFFLGQNRLTEIFGQNLEDGTYTLRLQASDAVGSESNEVLVFTLDTTAPSVDLRTPKDNADNSNTIRLIGSVEDSGVGVESAEFNLDNGAINTLNIDSNGRFDSSFTPDILSIGEHNTNISIIDRAGNQNQQRVNFSVTSDFVITPNSSTGWGLKTTDGVMLGERDSYLVETQIPIELGQTSGSRTLSFDIHSLFDNTDTNNFLSDQLLVYLVDPTNPEQTLLDNGKSGTPVFSLAGEEAEFKPGLVRFDGTKVEIDLTSLADKTSGLLLFQLLNPDSDTESAVMVNNITNTVDPEGTANPIFPDTETEASLGEALDLSQLNPSNEVEVIITDVSLDSLTGKYSASVQVKNQGESLDRNIAVVFPDLPSGVELLNASGVDSNGLPYISMREAILPGGLQKGAISDPVAITFDNPDLIRFGFNPTVLVGGANVAPTFESVGTLTVTPGDTLEVPLIGVDSNGDLVTFNIETDATLPTGKLEGNGKLIFTPTPEEIGTYQFNLIATDGVKDTTQTVTLNVVADPITTTRVSGVIQNTDSEPLAGVVIEIGDLITTTNSDGSFTLETVGELPDDTLKVRGEGIEGDKVYPFIAEKLPLVLGKEVYDGYNNVINRPIYLPALDVANAQTIDPELDLMGK